jgi:hypothetical protein
MPTAEKLNKYSTSQSFICDKTLPKRESMAGNTFETIININISYDPQQHLKFRRHPVNNAPRILLMDHFSVVFRKFEVC